MIIAGRDTQLDLLDHKPMNDWRVIAKRKCLWPLPLKS